MNIIYLPLPNNNKRAEIPSMNVDFRYDMETRE